ncbi:MAG TPA: pyruvate synthase, partial [Spirochaetia bacterium]|nr:pyruvate synthase [Spirochaetia bacterium]
MSKKEQVFMVESGNELAALAASQINYHVMGYFPITPSTQIAEYLDELKAKGKNTVNMVPGDGEHGAAGICYGASTAGGRVLNATSANGLLYALEQLPVQSGTRFPMVLNVVNRTVSGPLDIKCDHSDIMMALNTGWLIIMGKDPQEVYDFNICAPRISEHSDIRLPIIVSSDGFFTSHQKRRVSIFKDEKVVQDFVGSFKYNYSSVDPKNPVTIGCYMNDPDLGNNHVQMAEVFDKAKKVIKDVFADYEKISGRKYDLVGKHKTEDAEVIIFAAGSSVETVITAVDNMREQGKKVGVVWPIAIRPFPKEEIAAALKNAKTIVALDRQDAYNGLGGNLSAEMKAALQEEGITTKVITRIYGLGGRELYIEEAEELFELGFKAIKDNVKKVDYYTVDAGKKEGKIPAGLKPMSFEMQDNGIKVEMGADEKLQVSGINLRNLTKQAKRFAPGHGACNGCGIFSGINTFMRGLKGHVVVLFHTGCGMVVSTGYPFTSHKGTYVHNLFQNGAATISGISEMFKERQRRGEIPADEQLTFLMVTGDGGADIGMGPIIGTANRNNNVIILEYDNEGYMNTGNQLSYSTPLGHATS